MLIDFHAHIFADALAPRARAVLMENSHGALHPLHGHDLSAALTAYLDAHGVDKSVVLPIVTKQRQTETINKWAASINDGEKIVAFGGIFPHTDDYKRDIDLVVSLGLKGIKLHPEYQEFVADEKEFVSPSTNTPWTRGLSSCGTRATIPSALRRTEATRSCSRA